MARYLTPIVGTHGNFDHLVAACRLASRQGGQVVALMIGLVPHTLPIGSDVPDLWSGLEYEAARARRLGRELGQDVETVLVLSDSAGEAVVQLVDECAASSICLAYEPGVLADMRRWRDRFWKTVLTESPCPLVLVRPEPVERGATRAAPVPGRALVSER